MTVWLGLGMLALVGFIWTVVSNSMYADWKSRQDKNKYRRYR